MSLNAALYEENILLPASENGGFFIPQPWEQLNGSRYTVLRKIGWGRHSSVWLAIDNTPCTEYQLREPYCAIKVLSISATKLWSCGIIQELQILKALYPTGHYIRLRDYFLHPYTFDPTHHHLCLVLPLMSVTLDSLRQGCLVPPIPAKVVLRDLLNNLIALHGLGLVHGDVRLSSMLLTHPYNNDTIDEILCQTGEMEKNFHGYVESGGTRLPIWVSRPIESAFETLDDVDDRGSFTLVGLSFARACGSNTTSTSPLIYPIELQSPELLLGGRLGWESDIWAVGCFTFQMLTGRKLFKPVSADCTESTKYDLLKQMTEASGETFALAGGTLRNMPLWDKYFDSEGMLRCSLFDSLTASRIRCTMQLEEMLREAIPPGLAKHAASFIRTCLTLDPSRRSTAKSLRRHSWQLDCNMPSLYRDTSPESETPVVDKDDHDVTVDYDDVRLGIGGRNFLRPVVGVKIILLVGVTSTRPADY
ncbi:kinase-like domain-containing protein [Cristinia sonorae]|uniref:Kinase-like domain-containing protein n=1 Tax=Cristinia sonorae TaxID=1940300 RepID=A0A8K0UK65_9AGAR|nr:kinase-like domain-containing protein [Cristinia sonorae]